MQSEITSRVRKLRSKPTLAEQALWTHLRRERFGVKFRRQQPFRLKLDGKIQLFIADFYCSKAKLALEVDGGVHLNQKDYDRARDLLISKLNIRVIRFTNDQILNEIETVLSTIKAALLKK